MKSSISAIWRWFFVLSMVLVFLSGMAVAARRTVTGDWQTIDEKTNKPSSIIRIYKKKGFYVGKVAKIYVEGKQRTNDRCKSCKDDRRNKPILGLEIIRGMKQERQNLWSGGTVLDPRDGKTYKAEMWLSKDAKVLYLRGYIGIPLFGLTTKWYRH